MELLYGQDGSRYEEELKKIIFKNLTIILGLMVDNTNDHGKTTKCMGVENFYGQMGININDR